MTEFSSCLSSLVFSRTRAGRSFLFQESLNAFPEKAMFFGADHVQANNAWPRAMDELFMHFSIKYVAPVLLGNCALLEELAEALLREEKLAERDINEIALKYRI